MTLRGPSTGSSPRVLSPLLEVDTVKPGFPPRTRTDVIMAALHGDDTAEAGDVLARGRAPVFALCRALLAAGANPNARIECYRGTTLAVVVKSLGRGALLTVKERDRGGPEIARWEAFPSSPVNPRIRQNGTSVQLTGLTTLSCTATFLDTS